MFKRFFISGLPCLVFASGACSNVSSETAAVAPEASLAAAVEPAVARAAPEPGSIAGLSETMSVTGEYTPLTLDRVARVALEDGRLIVHGSTANVALDLPTTADASRTTRHWALVTERHLENGRRSLTFTHSESLEDFTIELPDSEGAVRYGGFEGLNGGEVLVFAWGGSSATYWGWVNIARLTPAR